MRKRMADVVALTAVCTLAVAGCGSGSKSGAAATSAAAPTSAAAAATSGAATPASTSAAAPASAAGSAAGSASGSAAASAPAATTGAVNTSVSGDITVLTNRTDLQQDGTLKKYAAAFNALYPKVKVTFQAITDYEGEVKTRMNTSNYGDVLLIPPSISRLDFSKFFEPLGTNADLSKKYNWTNAGTADGQPSSQVYGLADFGNANGFVYNKKVWAAAGITSDPTTPAAFITDLQAIKSKTSAIPLYTNYHDGWPLQGYYGAVGSATCNVNANDDLATDSSPWGAGKDLNIIDTLVFNAAKDKLIEADPTTTNWENSKTLLATGKTSAMWLGSWAITQMQAAATAAKADPADIGFMPFPAQVNGKFCSVTGQDYLQAINKHSKHIDAAKAWLTWFTDSSGFAKSQGSIPTLKGGALPSTFADYTKVGVTYITLNQNKGGVVSKVDNESEIGITSAPDSMQELVNIGRGAASGSLDGEFSKWNGQWASAIKSVAD